MGLNSYSELPWTEIQKLAEQKGWGDYEIRIKLRLQVWQLKTLKIGMKRIDQALAETLEKQLGNTATYWISRDNRYLLQNNRRG